MRGAKSNPTREQLVESVLAAAERLVREGVKLARTTGLPWSKIEERLRLREHNGNNAWRLAGNKNKLRIVKPPRRRQVA